MSSIPTRNEHLQQSNTISIYQTRKLILQALKKGAAVSHFTQVLTKLITHKHLLQKAFLALAKKLPRQLVRNIQIKNKFATQFEQKQWETHLQRIREEQLVLLAENRLLVQKVKDLSREKRYTHSPTFGTSTNATIPHQYVFIKLVQYNIRNQLVYSFIKWKFRTQALRENEKQYYLCSAIALHMWNSCHTAVNKYSAFYHVWRQVKCTTTNQKQKPTCVSLPIWKTLHKKNHSYTHPIEHLCGTHTPHPLSCCVSNSNSAFMLKYNVTPLTHSRNHKPWVHDPSGANCCSSYNTEPFNRVIHDQTPEVITFLKNRQRTTTSFNGE